MENTNITSTFSKDAQAVVFNGDCLSLLSTIPDSTVQLVITSPPYNIGKQYEKNQPISEYLNVQTKVISECVRTLKNEGSICWQVGNYVNNGEIIPLDILFYPIFKDLGLKLRNRIVWHFGHGLHCSKRLSGRYETILWFTKSDNYYFNLDPIRVPQKYPGKKYFKGPRKGEYSCNPLGCNPTDFFKESVNLFEFPIETHAVSIGPKEFEDFKHFFSAVIFKLVDCPTFMNGRFSVSNSSMLLQDRSNSIEQVISARKTYPNFIFLGNDVYATISIKASSNKIEIEFGRNRWVFSNKSFSGCDSKNSNCVNYFFAINVKVENSPLLILANWMRGIPLPLDIINKLDIFRRQAEGVLLSSSNLSTPISNQESQDISLMMSDSAKIFFIKAVLSIAFDAHRVSMLEKSFVMHTAKPLRDSFFATNTTKEISSFRDAVSNFSLDGGSLIDNNLRHVSIPSPVPIVTCGTHSSSNNLSFVTDRTYRFHNEYPVFLNISLADYDFPSDVWDISNVKHNHPEKTSHPCQFPTELVNRLVLSMSQEKDWVMDPYLGSGTTVLSAIKNNRRGIGCEIFPEYYQVSIQRISSAL